MLTDFALQLPYPTVTGKISEREAAGIYDLYAGRFSELEAITSYMYQAIIMHDDDKIGNILRQIGIVEMRHLDLLGEALCTFDHDPVFTGKYNYFTTGYTSYINDTRQILLYDIEDEKRAAESYRNLADITDNLSLCELLVRIAMDEELHERILIEKYEELFNC